MPESSTLAMPPAPLSNIAELETTSSSMLAPSQNSCGVFPVGGFGSAVIVTDVVAVPDAHPPEAAMVYVTVYTPAVLLEGIIKPVVLLIVKPTGDDVNPPPVVPVNVTEAGEAELQ
jgi:hypothetical protein